MTETAKEMAKRLGVTLPPWNELDDLCPCIQYGGKYECGPCEDATCGSMSNDAVVEGVHVPECTWKGHEFARELDKARRMVEGGNARD